MDADKELSDTDKALVEVFCSRLAAAFDNVTLYEELERANLRLEEKVARRTAQLLAAKERLENQSERLKRANAFKSEVLGTVAHDLKNPLGVILGRTEMLTELLADVAVAGEGCARPDRAYPPVGAPPDRDGGGSDRRRAGRRASTSRSAPTSSTSACSSPRCRRPIASSPRGKEQDIARHRRSRTSASRRHGAAARGGRQSRQQRREIQPDRRADRRSSPQREGGEAVVRVADQGPGLSPEDSEPALRPLPAAFGQADRRRKLDRARPLDRQTHHRPSQRPHLRGKSRSGGRGGLCDRIAAPR